MRAVPNDHICADINNLMRQYLNEVSRFLTPITRLMCVNRKNDKVSRFPRFLNRLHNCMGIVDIRHIVEATAIGSFETMRFQVTYLASDKPHILSYLFQDRKWGWTALTSGLPDVPNPAEV